MAGSVPEAAVGLAGPGERARLIIHGDRGCHHRWPGRASVCEGAGVVRSTSRRGRPPDSSRTEGLFGTMESETLCGRDWEGVGPDGLGKKTDGRMEWHDTKGIRRSLGSTSPLAYRQSLGLAAWRERYGKAAPPLRGNT